MHTDLSQHLHSSKCNELIALLAGCRENNPFGKIFGYCNAEDYRLTKCLKEERLERRDRNYQKSLETRAKFQRIWQEESEQKQGH